MRPLFALFIGGLFLTACTSETPEVQEMVPEAISFTGQPLFSAEPSADLMARYEEKKSAFEADSLDIENVIWFGRFTAYIGRYNDAIAIYTRAIERFPKDARLYRHRGHRYITIRKIDEAIGDFETAARLVEGSSDQIEPDGMPNAQNTPVSTLHGNIWYHLGLAYYLKNDLENALRGFNNCLATSTNADNVVSATHWLYMIHRRLGHETEASAVLNDISIEMNIIENFAYHHLDLFYKGEKEESDLRGEGPANDAILYGIANWYLYSGDISTAKQKLEAILTVPSWASFGFIAAESDMARMQHSL